MPSITPHKATRQHTQRHPTAHTTPPASSQNATRHPHQAELDADAWLDEDADDGRTQLMSTAGIMEMEAKPLMIFSNFEHADTWVQLWGAQHQPMKMLPGGSKSRRVYVCRHPLYGKYSTRKKTKKTKASARAPWKKSAACGSTSCTATEESLAATEVCSTCPCTTLAHAR